jgi:hypothetical protein
MARTAGLQQAVRSRSALRRGFGSPSVAEWDSENGLIGPQETLAGEVDGRCVMRALPAGPHLSPPIIPRSTAFGSRSLEKGTGSRQEMEVTPCASSRTTIRWQPLRARHRSRGGGTPSHGGSQIRYLERHGIPDLSPSKPPRSKQRSPGKPPSGSGAARGARSRDPELCVRHRR